MVRRVIVHRAPCIVHRATAHRRQTTYKRHRQTNKRHIVAGTKQTTLTNSSAWKTADHLIPDHLPTRCIAQRCFAVVSSSYRRGYEYACGVWIWDIGFYRWVQETDSSDETTKCNGFVRTGMWKPLGFAFLLRDDRGWNHSSKTDFFFCFLFIFATHPDVLYSVLSATFSACCGRGSSNAGSKAERGGCALERSGAEAPTAVEREHFQRSGKVRRFGGTTQTVFCICSFIFPNHFVLCFSFYSGWFPTVPVCASPQHRQYIRHRYY